MYLYAIYSPTFDGYVTRGSQPTITYLSPSTSLYKTKEEAEKAINSKYRPDFDKSPTILQTKLAWDLLESIHKINRWHINIPREEFLDAFSQFKDLEVVKIYMAHIDEKKDKARE